MKTDRSTDSNIYTSAETSFTDNETPGISGDDTTYKSSAAPANSDSTKVVLAGNPNVGKSMVFNFLSGMYVDVSNFPGTTVSITQARYKEYDVYDTPGVYGISSFNDEEKVARDVILSGDIVLNVVNALNLERDLFLTLQLIDMGKKTAVLLNFSDELRKRNIRIDTAKLSELLGVPVIETSALTGNGFERIDEAITTASHGKRGQEVHDVLKYVRSSFPQTPLSDAEQILIAEGDKSVIDKYDLTSLIQPDSPVFSQREKLYISRRIRVNQIASEAELEDSRKGEFFHSLGRYSLNPVTGIPILIMILCFVYFFIGDIVSQRVVGFTENTLGKNGFEYYTKAFVAGNSPVDITLSVTDNAGNIVEKRILRCPEGTDRVPFSKSLMKNFHDEPNREIQFSFRNPFIKLLFGEFGIITMTISYLLFLLLPLVVSFYFVMAFLEDSGYLPRLATMLDRTFNMMGLNGRAVIPVILGFGCVTMATITTRLLSTEREKTIITAILQFVIPCSAQLAVIAVLMSTVGAGYFLIYAATIFTVLILLSTLLNKFLPGEPSPLLIDLPAMRMPGMKNVLKKMYFRAWGFMKEAVLWFFVGALAVGLLDISGMLNVWQELLAPLTMNWLKLPREASNAFVMGLIRRDFGAAGLFHLMLSPAQKVVSLTVITLFVPCIASFVMMLKERGYKQGLIIWFSTWFFAFLIGGILAQIII